MNENEEELFLEEEDAPASISFVVEDFEGPLDLLLKLITEKKMDIKTVKLADITEQYLQSVRDLQLDMENASSFLTMASWLLEIKSRSLLPNENPTEEEDDPETRLKLQLEEYMLFKEASEKLQLVENVDRFYKQPDKNVGDPRIILNDFNLNAMLDAFALILSRAVESETPPEPKQIQKDRWTVAEKVGMLKTILQENHEINFFSLFDDNYSKLEKITVFLAILELLKMQLVTVEQTDRYEDIKIVSRSNTNED